MGERLAGCLVAVVIADGIDERLPARLKSALSSLGARVHLVSPGGVTVESAQGRAIEAAADLRVLHPRYYDALVMAGADVAAALAGDVRAEALVREMHAQRRVLGAIGNGSAVLVRAGVGPGDEGVVASDEQAAAGAFVDALERELLDLRLRDGVDESSIESFPASDARA